MFDSLDELSRKLAATGYFIDPVMVQVVYLAAKLKKPAAQRTVCAAVEVLRFPQFRW